MAYYAQCGYCQNGEHHRCRLQWLDNTGGEALCMCGSSGHGANELPRDSTVKIAPGRAISPSAMHPKPVQAQMDPWYGAPWRDGSGRRPTDTEMAAWFLTLPVDRLADLVKVWREESVRAASCLIENHEAIIEHWKQRAMRAEVDRKTLMDAASKQQALHNSIPRRRLRRFCTLCGERVIPVPVNHRDEMGLWMHADMSIGDHDVRDVKYE